MEGMMSSLNNYKESAYGSDSITVLVIVHMSKELQKILLKALNQLFISIGS